MGDFDEHVFQSILKNHQKSLHIVTSLTQGQYPRHNSTINEQSRRRERRKSLQGLLQFLFLFFKKKVVRKCPQIARYLN